MVQKWGKIGKNVKDDEYLICSVVGEAVIFEWIFQILEPSYEASEMMADRMTIHMPAVMIEVLH